MIQALKKELQLLRDMDVRWSSTFYMIERAIELEEPLMDMLESSEFEELWKFQLTDADWDVLCLCYNILKVNFIADILVLIVVLTFGLYYRFPILSNSFYLRRKPPHSVVLFLHLSISLIHGNNSKKAPHMHMTSFKLVLISWKCTTPAQMQSQLILYQ